MNAVEHYLSEIEAADRRAGGQAAGTLGAQRRAAAARFAELGFPTPRLEDWRFTNTAPLAATGFVTAPAAAGVNGTGTTACLERGVVPVNRLVFVNGHLARSLSNLAGVPEGVRVASVADVLAEHPALVEANVGRHATWDAQAFVALNTAFLHDGAVVHVPDGCVVREPIGLVFVSRPNGRPTVSHPRILIVAGRDAQATVVESYVGEGGGAYFTNAVTELVAGSGARVEHCKVQWEGAGAFHIATLAASAGRDSQVTCHSVSIGGALVRNDVRALLDGEGAECVLNGLYVVGGAQHVDNHTVIDHARPHCTSRETYKGVLDGTAHGVFGGRIIVRPAAQRTVARQANNNLLLSEQSVVNTKPQLEINADDVKCYHGATVGMLDEDALFYLRARGLDRATARALLVRGFLGEIVAAIGVPSLRDALDRVIGERLTAVLGGGGAA
jgi:Fe-S cluster assembly protein SufD